MENSTIILNTFFNGIGRVFKDIEIVETTLDKVDKNEINYNIINYSLLIYYSELLNDLAPFIYIAHTKALIKRIVNIRTLKDCNLLLYPTESEICRVLSEMSLRTPLQRHYTALYIQSFQKVIKLSGTSIQLLSQIPMAESEKEDVKQAKHHIEQTFITKNLDEDRTNIVKEAFKKFGGKNDTYNSKPKQLEMLH